MDKATKTDINHASQSTTNGINNYINHASQSTTNGINN